MEKEIKKCPKCGSEKNEKNSPFSPRIRDGEEFSSQPHPAQYYCLVCKYNWPDNENSY